MGDVTKSEVLLSFGAETDEKSFSKLLSALRKTFKEIGVEVKRADKNKFDLSAVIDDSKLDSKFKGSTKKIEAAIKTLFKTISSVPKDKISSDIQSVIDRTFSDLVQARTNQVLTEAKKRITAAQVRATNTRGKAAQTDFDAAPSGKPSKSAGSDEFWERVKGEFHSGNFPAGAQAYDFFMKNASNARLQFAGLSEANKFVNAIYATGNKLRSVSKGFEDWEKDLDFDRINKAQRAGWLNYSSTGVNIRDRRGLNVLNLRDDGSEGSSEVLAASGYKGIAHYQRRLQAALSGFPEAIESYTKAFKKTASLRGEGNADIWGPQFLNAAKAQRNAEIKGIPTKGWDIPSLMKGVDNNHLSITKGHFKALDEEGLRLLKTTKELAKQNGMLGKSFRANNTVFEKLRKEFSDGTAAQDKYVRGIVKMAETSISKQIVQKVAELQRLGTLTRKEIDEQRKSFAKTLNLEDESRRILSARSTPFNKYEGSAAGLQGSMQRLDNDPDYIKGTKKYNDAKKALLDMDKVVLKTATSMNKMGLNGTAFYETANRWNMALGKGKDILTLSNGQIAQMSQRFAAMKAPSALGKFFTDLQKKFVTLIEYSLSGAAIYGIGAAFAKVRDTIVQFDQALYDLKAITGATDIEMAMMGDKILNLASSTKYSTTEIAGAMKVMGQAGFSASETLSAIDPVAKLSMATLSDLTSTVDLVTTAIGAFNMQTSDAGRVADIFAAAMNKSKLDLEKLKVAFNYVGPIAHDAGVSIEETATMMSLLSNAGIRASTIGTSMRKVFDSLLNPSKEFTEAIAAAGYTLKDFNPKESSMIDILQRIREIAPDAEKALKYFGDRAASSVVVLGSTSVEEFKKMEDAIRRQGGVYEMAAIQMEGLDSKIKKMFSNLEVLIVKLSDLGVKSVFGALIDSITWVLELINNFSVDHPILSFFSKLAVNVGLAVLAVRGLQLVLATNLGGALAANIAILHAHSSALGAGSAAMALFQTVASGAAATMTKWATTAASFLGPWGMVIVGVTAGITAFVAIKEAIENSNDAYKKAINELEDYKRTSAIATEQKNKEISSYKNLTAQINDNRESLNSRKMALLQLINMGVGLDRGILANINSVEDFDKALKNSMPVIEQYGKKLSSELKAIQTAEWKLTEAAANAAEKRKGELIGTATGKEFRQIYAAGIIPTGVIETVPFTEEDKAEYDKVAQTAKAARETQVNFVRDHFKDKVEMIQDLQQQVKSGKMSESDAIKAMTEDIKKDRGFNSDMDKSITDAIIATDTFSENAIKGLVISERTGKKNELRGTAEKLAKTTITENSKVKETLTSYLSVGKQERDELFAIFEEDTKDLDKGSKEYAAIKDKYDKASEELANRQSADLATISKRSSASSQSYEKEQEAIRKKRIEGINAALAGKNSPAEIKRLENEKFQLERGAAMEKIEHDKELLKIMEADPIAKDLDATRDLRTSIIESETDIMKAYSSAVKAEVRADKAEEKEQKRIAKQEEVEARRAAIQEKVRVNLEKKRLLYEKEAALTSIKKKYSGDEKKIFEESTRVENEYWEKSIAISKKAMEVKSAKGENADAEEIAYLETLAKAHKAGRKVFKDSGAEKELREDIKIQLETIKRNGAAQKQALDDRKLSAEEMLKRKNEIDQNIVKEQLAYLETTKKDAAARGLDVDPITAQMLSLEGKGLNKQSSVEARLQSLYEKRNRENAAAFKRSIKNADRDAEDLAQMELDEIQNKREKEDYDIEKKYAGTDNLIAIKKIENAKVFAEMELVVLKDLYKEKKRLQESGVDIDYDMISAENEISKKKAEIAMSDLERSRYINSMRVEAENSINGLIQADKDDALAAELENRYATDQDLLAQLEESHRKEREALITQYEGIEELTDIYEQRKSLLAKKHAEQDAALQRTLHQRQFQEKAEFFADMSDIMGEFYSSSGEKMKAFLAFQKALTIAEIWMNAAAAASKAEAFNDVFGISYEALIYAKAAARTGMVAAQTIGELSFAEGGKVPGYSPSPTADNISARVTANEWIVPVGPSQYYGDGIMEAIRTASIPRSILDGYRKGTYKSSSRHFAEGGKAVSTGDGGSGNVSNVTVNIHGGDASSIKQILPQLEAAIKKAVNDDIRNDGEIRKTIKTYVK